MDINHRDLSILARTSGREIAYVFLGEDLMKDVGQRRFEEAMVKAESSQSAQVRLAYLELAQFYRSQLSLR